MSDFRMSKSPTPNIRDNKSCPNSAKPTKAKKRVSFNDSLVQVHLIPNVSNILNIEKYKCYMRNSSAVTATMISSSPCTDMDTETYYQVNYQSVDSKFVPQESTANVDEKALNSESLNSDLCINEQNSNENDPNQNVISFSNQLNNSNNTQENSQNSNDLLTAKGNYKFLI
jgi:hypothetical protein